MIGHLDLETELCDVKNQNLGNAVRKRPVCTPTATVQGPGLLRYTRTVCHVKASLG
jgi:hypothetical protein